ncbi:MAG: hypothetical protein ABI222_13700, partial [Opitutaceae bacterium]
MVLRINSIVLLGFCTIAEALASGRTASSPAQAVFSELLRDPTAVEWRSLSRFDQTLTRREFENRLEFVFDPSRGLQEYLRIRAGSVEVYPTVKKDGQPWAVVRFAPKESARLPLPASYRTPRDIRAMSVLTTGLPLAGLNVAIEPADIGGRWARMEDRSVDFPGYGRINEGDINLVVGRLLRDKLQKLGAKVFLVRDQAEPVLTAKPEQLEALVIDVLANRPEILPESFRHRTASLPIGSPKRLQIAEESLLTKTLETRARAALVRASFRPDLTIVLQHNATPASSEGRLNPINRNVFFVHGAYTSVELREAEQRFRLLTKLLEDVAPVESEVAAAIAARFRDQTGFPPVLSGNSANTRLVI